MPIQSKPKSLSTVAALAWQAGVAAVFLAAWEYAGTTSLGGFTSQPSRIALHLHGWLVNDLYHHVFITLTEMVLGILIGGTAGVLAGLALGRAPYLSSILRPLVVALYSVPVVALSPLFIIFFGLYMLPKIVLVAKVVFFLMFFSAFQGVNFVDQDQTNALRLMGASRLEVFCKVVLPGCMVWIIGGLKIALPYALVAAVTGEMLAATGGIGFLLSEASLSINMTGLYAALVILIVFGLLVGDASIRLERWLLRWRNPSR